jgi:UDP-glucose 6-dehydrogenase
MKLGIAGVGVVGGALERWLKANTAYEVLTYDPERGRQDDLSGVVALFVCVPVPTEGRQQDLTIVDDTLKRFGNKNQKVFIRSTVLPGTCDRLSAKHGLQVFAMPEFLTERIADQDVACQSIVCGAPRGDEAGHYVFVHQVFGSEKDILLMSNVEAELAKYMHNGNGTIKVAFNNIIYQLAKRLGADYGKVRHGALMSGYVSSTHTQVPGPDGVLGYGGKCFPKDMEALIGELLRHDIPCDSLAYMQEENERLRKLGSVRTSA